GGSVGWDVFLTKIGTACCTTDGGRGFAVPLAHLIARDTAHNRTCRHADNIAVIALWQRLLRRFGLGNRCRNWLILRCCLTLSYIISGTCGTGNECYSNS